MKAKDEFAAADTKRLKGVAIILMLIHHLWFFPNRLAGGELKYLADIFGNSSLYLFGNFGKICVSLFFFLGGYGIYCQSKKKNFNILNNLKKIYIAYWKVFLIFIPIALIFFTNQIAYCELSTIYARFDGWSWKEVFQNFFGFSNTFNGEWWFLKSYIIAIALFPFIKKIFDKNSFLKNIIFIIIASILMTNLFPALGKLEYLGNLNNNFLYRTIFCQSSPYITCFYIGVLFAKENYIIKLKNILNKVIKINCITDIIAIGIIIFFRNYIANSEMDILYVPLLVIFISDLFKYMPKVGDVFNNLGEHSTNMWLIHSFYCYYFYVFVQIVVGLRWGVPCLLVLILLSYLSSLAVNYFWSCTNTLTNIITKYIKDFKTRKA